MKELTTREAAVSLLYDPEVYSGLSDAEKSNFRSYRKRLEDGEKISTDKIEALLVDFGFKVVQEKLWREPKTKKKEIATQLFFFN